MRAASAISPNLWRGCTQVEQAEGLSKDTSQASTFLAAGTLRKVLAHNMPPKRKAAAGRKLPAAAAAAAADSAAASRQKKAEPVASEETTEVNVYVFDARWQKKLHELYTERKLTDIVLHNG